MVDSYCTNCGEEFKGTEVFYSTVYYECLGKICPTCKKKRKIGKIKVIDGGGVSSWSCPRCKQMTSDIITKFEENGQGVCEGCFLERESKDGCICGYSKQLFCPICDKVHAKPRICKKCLEKQTSFYQHKQIFLKVVLPTAIISLIIGFF